MVSRRERHIGEVTTVHTDQYIQLMTGLDTGMN